MSKALSNELAYKELLIELSQQIRSAQAKAALSVNSTLIQLYWNLGRKIAENQQLFEGRNNYVAQLAKDLKEEFPDTTGFSRSNLFSIRKFYQFYFLNSVQQAVGLKELPGSIQERDSSDKTEKPGSVQQAAGLNTEDILQLLIQVPWGHHILILNKVKKFLEAVFYLQQTKGYNWSRAILTLQMEQNLYQRQGKAITNFQATLSEQQAVMAGQILKDPYNFGFITLEPKMQELDIERQLTEHITKFLLELGKGFAFIGRQYPLQIGEKDYRLDLLFYHIRLRCFVVIDLKVVEFEPEFAGKMNFYLSVIDDQLKTTDDQPSIGIILCKNKNKLEVEYALQGMNKPIGVSEFRLTQALPADLKSTLPTVEEFEHELKNQLQ
jgi:predicted nuclease of restriction endonuclease-like (RecB) superfamily